MTRIGHTAAAAWRLYRDGFRNMTWGRTLWVIIIVKVLVIFLVLRLFFFRPALDGLTEAEKQAAVAGKLAAGSNAAD